jgi:hypothetical protein
LGGFEVRFQAAHFFLELDSDLPCGERLAAETGAMAARWQAPARRWLMSSTDPTRLPGGGTYWTAYLDAVRQQQQAVIDRLTQAQRQVAKLAAMKTPPSPVTTVQDIQAKLNDQLATTSTAVAQGSAAFAAAVAQRDATAAEAEAEKMRSMLTFFARQAEALKAQVEAHLRAVQAAQRTIIELLTMASEARTVLSQQLEDMHRRMSG